MLNSILISVWAILVTLAVFSLQQGNGDDESNGKETVIELIDHRTDAISTALFDDGKVVGHLTTRIHFQLQKGTEELVPVALDLIIEDGLFDVTFNMKAHELIKLKENDLKSLASKLQQTLGQRKTPLAIRNVRFENTRLMLKSS